MPNTLKFVDLGQKMPEKRDAEKRRDDFDEIYREFARDAAKAQASRCSQCGIPFCQVHCPLHNNIPDWLHLCAEGRLQEAYDVSSATNSMPEICGRICPQDRLCEGNCVIEQSGHGTVTIGAVEKYITEQAWDQGWVRPISPGAERPESVGIIGAGPAGMAAAERLRRRGYQVDVYDRHDRIGGLLVYGIPNFKLEKNVVARRADHLRDGGVRFHMNVNIGNETDLAELRRRHDAVLIATGVYKSRDIMVPGVGLDNVVPALTYLIASNRKGLGDSVAEFDSGRLDADGKSVAVIGGGDTAMDCVRTAIRQGARAVTCLYRRDRENMPGSMREVQHAEEEGVAFSWLSAPEAFLGNTSVGRVRAIRMRLGPADSSGRRTPVPVEQSQFTMDAGLVIMALGFDPEDLPGLFRAPELAITRWGTVRTNLRNMMTNLDGVFAAGDIVRGASLVVWAIRDGRDAADSIHTYLRNKTASATERAPATTATAAE